MEFPFKYLKEILKATKKYMDVMYITEDGNIRGFKKDDSLGEYVIMPEYPEKLKDFAPLVIDSELYSILNKMKASNVEFTKCKDEAFLSDGTLTVSFIIPHERYDYAPFVCHVFSHLTSYKFTRISDKMMSDLESGKLITVDARYSDPNEEPIQLMVSGKDFNISKSLTGIFVAAVNKDTEYQKKCDHNHVVVMASYDKIACVYLLCGVV